MRILVLGAGGIGGYYGGRLAAAGVELGGNYPRPLVGLLLSRELALEAYQRIRRR